MNLESQLCEHLASLIDRATDGDEIDRYSDDFLAVDQGLRRWAVSANLAEVYEFWKRETVDYIEYAIARRTSVATAEFVGTACWLPECWWTAVHVHLRISRQEQRVSWMECRVGEKGRDTGGMTLMRSEADARNWNRRFLKSLTVDDVEWAYAVTFGKRIADG